MHPCDELKNIVLHHYGQFDSGEQSASIENKHYPELIRDADSR